MGRPRPPLGPAKQRRTRILLALATVVLVAGLTAEEISGHGLWTTGLIGWFAVVVAVGVGAGADNAAGIAGLGGVLARLRHRFAERPRNDADWS